MDDVSSDSIEDQWNSPLVKEHFNRIRNSACCKLCKKKFPLYSVTLENHLQVKHQFQYHQFTNTYKFKLPTKTYSQSSKQKKKCPINNDPVRTRKDKKFEAMIKSRSSPQPYNYHNYAVRNARKERNLNRGKSCICGTCIPHKVVENFPKENFPKETDEVNTNKSVYNRNELGPERLNNDNSFVDLHSNNCDNGLEEILPDPQPKEVNTVEVKEEPVQHDRIENVINSCQTTAVAHNSKVTYLRTYSRARKNLQLNQTQGTSSYKGTDFPSGYTSTSCVQAVLQDLSGVNLELVQSGYNNKLYCVDIPKASQEGSVDFQLCDNQECILPDPDPTQVVKPKEEPPDAYGDSIYQTENNVLDVNILPVAFPGNEENSLLRRVTEKGTNVNITSDQCTATRLRLPAKKWMENETTCLLDLYSELQPQVKNRKISSMKKMWEALAERMVEAGYDCTALQVENRWKTFKRANKKTEDKAKETVRSHLDFVYQANSNLLLITMPLGRMSSMRLPNHVRKIACKGEVTKESSNHTDNFTQC